jgi:regulator of sigma D
MTKCTPYEVLFGGKANILGQLQQRTAPVYNYDDIVHNYDIDHDVKQKLQTCDGIGRANLVQLE